jgi:tRNA(Phe) wybutosine-synthesizing methylase Tyw3
LSPNKRKHSSPRRGSVKRKRDYSKERDASNERKRLISQDAFQALLNKWSNSNKADKNKNIQLLKNELNKNKNKTMNLLSNKGNVKRKFTFKLGNPLGIKI